MLDLNVILDVITVGLLALGGYLLRVFVSATKTAIDSSAEAAAKATIQQLQWPAELTRELQKTRGIERQELRYKSYGKLWKELRPLAIYDATDINKKEAKNLSSKLSNWYFSESGGLLLTSQARNFYFALQDLLRITTSCPKEWSADRTEASAGRQVHILRTILEKCGANEALCVLDYFSTEEFDDWQIRARDLGKTWREGVKTIAEQWDKLDEKERFVTLQQAGSKLRSSLVIDLESRLR